METEIEFEPTQELIDQLRTVAAADKMSVHDVLIVAAWEYVIRHSGKDLTVDDIKLLRRPDILLAIEKDRQRARAGLQGAPRPQRMVDVNLPPGHTCDHDNGAAAQ